MKKVTLDAKLIFDNGQLIGWHFIAKDKAGKRVLDGLMSGRIAGLPYCEDKVIRPWSGGCGEYWIGFPIQDDSVQQQDEDCEFTADSLHKSIRFTSEGGWTTS